MVVVTLTNCPPALRGDITLWLQEIDTGVYVGRMSARVRDRLWDRIRACCGSGRAVMVYSSNNEQRMEFRVHNSDWEPIDFDGIRMMLKPSAARMHAKGKQDGYRSRTAGIRTARKFQALSARSKWIFRDYAVIDVETTGLNAGQDSIIEVAALIVRGGEAAGSFSALIKQDAAIGEKITRITGITDEMLDAEGIDEKEAIAGVLEAIGDMTVVCHNAAFDYGFLRAACRRHGLSMLRNPYVDTAVIAKNAVEGVRDCKLKTLAEFFDIQTETFHRSLPDCVTTKLIYDKLTKIADQIF